MVALASILETDFKMIKLTERMRYWITGSVISFVTWVTLAIMATFTYVNVSSGVILILAIVTAYVAYGIGLVAAEEKEVRSGKFAASLIPALITLVIAPIAWIVFLIVTPTVVGAGGFHWISLFSALVGLYGFAALLQSFMGERRIGWTVVGFVLTTVGIVSYAFFSVWQQNYTS